MDEEVSLLAIPFSDTLDWFFFFRDGVPFVDAVAPLPKGFFFSLSLGVCSHCYTANFS
jgi:hypothetical protein